MAHTIDSFINSIRRHLVPIHPEGYVFIVIFGLMTLLLFFLSSILGWIGLVLTGWCTYFFRDPPRVTPLRENIVVSPADGVVCDITYLVPPLELNLGPEERQRISIFMNVFDCHINRAPIEGRIEKIVYRPGLFLNAELNKASEHNERNALIIEHALGRFGVVQIAGLIARRIATFKQEGHMVERGERFGIIRFGSRVDVYLPSTFYVCVGLGSRTIAGETVIADSLPSTLVATFKTG